MKKTALNLLFTLSFSLCLHTWVVAQEQRQSEKSEDSQPEMRTLFDNKGKNTINGFGGPLLGFTSLKGSQVFQVGGEGGIILNRHWAIGLYGIGITRSKFTQDNQDLRVSGGHGGLLLEYTTDMSRLLHFSLPLRIGGGGFVTELDNSEDNNNLTNVSSAVISPGLRVELNLTKFAVLFGSAEYRYFVSDISDEYLSRSDLSGASFLIGFKFGRILIFFNHIFKFIVMLNSVVKVFIISLALAAFQMEAFSQELTQNVRGIVTDAQSGYPLPGVTVRLMNAEGKGTISNFDGEYVLTEVPIGRITLQFSFIGFESATANNLLLTAGKELIVDVKLKESTTELAEVVVTAETEGAKGGVINEMAAVSSRGFSVEEASRYAGSRNDPARMAMNFAGVSGSNDSRNDIIIRGNSPTGLLWRLDGLDIPSPNHFSSLGTTGGPVSMLNNNLLQNSDFFTSAFPSEYGNALSGVFDLKMRTGNRSQHEFLGQIGFNGFEFGAEGPLSKESKATYIVNGRYSLLGIAKALGANFGTGAAIPTFADISAKVDIPTAKNGRFSWFAITGWSNVDLLGSELEDRDATDNFGSFYADLTNSNRTVITGVSHLAFLNKDTSLENTIGFSNSRFNADITSLHRSRSDEITARVDSIDQKLNQTKITWHSRMTKKLSAKSDLKVGFIVERSDFDFVTSLPSPVLQQRGREGTDSQGDSYLLQTYLSWKQYLASNFNLIAGLRFQKFFLNENSAAIEPRLALEYNLRPNHRISIGYGRHNQTQPIQTYFFSRVLGDGTKVTNENLGFSTSDQLVLGYDWNVNPNLRVKFEVYRQWLSNVPVNKQPTSFSMLNFGADLAFPNVTNLTNKGTGFNQGVELTVERFFNDSYYFLWTTSLFESKYKGSDGIERNTAFNGNYNINFLFGKEIQLGKSMQLVFDVKYTHAGGRRFTPVDFYASRFAATQELDDTKAFEGQYNDYSRLDMRLTFRMNIGKLSQEWALDVQNVLDRQNQWVNLYDNVKNEVVQTQQLGFFPVVFYRILF